MKKVLAMVALAVATLPVMAQQTKYSIKGTAPAGSKMVYLGNRDSREVLDSAAVSGGKFSLEGSYAKDALLYVRVDEAPRFVIMFNDGTPATVDLNTNVLKGSAQNQSLNYYDRQNDSLMMQVSALRSEVLDAYYDTSVPEEERESNAEKKGAEVKPELDRLINKDKELMDQMLKENAKTLVPAAFVDNLLAFYGMEGFKEMLDANPPYASHPAVDEIKYRLAQEEAKKKAEAAERHRQDSIRIASFTLEQMDSLRRDSVQRDSIAKAKPKPVRRRKNGKPIANGEFIGWTDITTSRSESIVENLLGESIQLHQDYVLGDVLKSRPMIVSYNHWYNYAVEAVIALLFVLGVWAGRRSRFMWLVMSYFALDMVLHIGLGFGINEVYIMSAHWIYAIPIAIAFLLKNVGRRRYQLALKGVLALLALWLWAWNVMLIVGYLY